MQRQVSFLVANDVIRFRGPCGINQFANEDSKLYLVWTSPDVTINTVFKVKKIQNRHFLKVIIIITYFDMFCETCIVCMSLVI